MRKLLSGAAVAAIAVASAWSANAAIVIHEDAGTIFTTFRGIGSAPVGRITVSSSQTISRFGVDVDLNGASNVKFLIFDSSSGSLLYSSAAKAFADTGAGYKFSDAFSFTFNVGTTYGLTAVSDTGGAYNVDFTANTIGAFSFLTGNQNNNGFANPVLDTSQNCCDVWTALDTDRITAGVPEPSTWAMMLIGFAGLGLASWRRRETASA